jgi:hypothetical protein
MVYVDEQADKHSALSRMADVEALPVKVRLDIAKNPEVDRHRRTAFHQTPLSARQSAGFLGDGVRNRRRI